MKTLSIAFLAVWISVAHAANPSFQSLNSTQLDTNGYKVSIKSGALLTNINAIGITNTPILSLSRDFGATGSGTETAKLQAAANSGRTVLIDTNITVADVYYTNNTVFIGDGHSTITIDATTVSNVLNGTSGISNWWFINVKIEGAKLGFASSQGSWRQNADSSITQVVSSQHSGIYAVYGNLNSGIVNCDIQDFATAGIILDGRDSPTFPQPTNSTIIIQNNRVADSWQGILTVRSAEYTSLDNNNIQRCGRAFDIESGNIRIAGGVATRNGIAFYIPAATINNPAKITVTGVVANHNSYYIQATGPYSTAYGGVFVGCSMIGGNGTDLMTFTNASGFVLEGCALSGNTIFTNSGSTNYIIGCHNDGAELNIVNVSSGAMLNDGTLNPNGVVLRTNNIPNVFSTNVIGSIGFTSTVSNATVFSLTMPATTVNFTNTNAVSWIYFIDNTAVTGTAVKKNGVTIFSGLSTDITIPLRSGETFSETYTIGTPALTGNVFP